MKEGKLVTSNKPHKIQKDVLLSYSEEQLMEILRAQMESDETDPALIEDISAALTAKLGEIPCDADAAYERFQTQYAGTEPLYDDVSEDLVQQPSRAKPRKLVRFALIAAVLVALLLGGVVTAGANGYNAWGAVAAWTGDLFRFSASNEERPDFTPLANFTECVRLALEQNGISDPLLPSYMPEEFAESEIIVTETLHGAFIVASYSNGKDELILQCRVSTSQDVREGYAYSKDEGDPETVHVGETEFQIMTNNGKYLAVWTGENVTYSIVGVSSREEIIKIISSVHGA